MIEEWKEKTCKNSLEAVHNKYCAGGETKLDKKWQTFFLKKNIEEIRENAQVLIVKYFKIFILDFIRILCFGCAGNI